MQRAPRWSAVLRATGVKILSLEIEKHGETTILAVHAIVACSLALVILSSKVSIVAGGIHQNGHTVVDRSTLGVMVGGVGIMSLLVKQHADGVIMRVALDQGETGILIVTGLVPQQACAQVDS